MAKTNGIFGDWSGKLGNVVGYRLHNSTNAITQGVRAYQPEVYNPKTLAQARQRVKVTAAVRFFKAFSEFLSISYEGKATNHACYCRQQSLALKMPLDAVPFLPKGAEFFVPAAYQVAEGSLPSLSVININDRGVGEGVACSLRCAQPLSDFNTFGAFCSSLLSQNIILKDGDTIFTIIAFTPDNGYTFIPFYAGFTLDASSTVPPAQMPSLLQSLGVYSLNGISYLNTCPPAAASQRLKAAAAAFAICRGDVSKPHSCLWSSALMAVASLVQELWCSEEQYKRAIVSYLPPSPALSSLLLNQAGTHPWAPVTPAPAATRVAFLRFLGEPSPYFILPFNLSTNTGFEFFLSDVVDSSVIFLFGGSFHSVGGGLGSLSVYEGILDFGLTVCNIMQASVFVEMVSSHFLFNFLNDKSISVISGEQRFSSSIPAISTPINSYIPLFTSSSEGAFILESTPFSVLSVNISEGSGLILRLVPARLGSTGGLLDTINNVFYPCEGSDNYELGPDIE